MPYLRARQGVPQVRRAAKPSEHAEQKAVCDWWRLACKGYGLPEFSLFAVPNGGARHPVVGRKLKAEGVRAGVPDLFLAVPRRYPAAEETPGFEFIGLFVEMKRKPNKPSPEQEDVLLYLRQRGYHAVIAWSADEAIRAIKAYLA